ncbi:MAG: pilus assembly protein PilM [Verrucomicrobia subdivision 3 bacterium]|nr:pilus assembly protein PilM [Limisphaerales bacterium]
MSEPKNIIPLPMAKLQRFRKRFRMRKPGQVTALDVDGTVLRIAQAELRGDRALVTRVDAVPLNVTAEDRADAEALGKAIRASLDSARIKPAFVVMGVPRAQVILRTLSLPASDDLSELAAMVHLQVGRELPFRKEEAAIDFGIRPQASVTPLSESAQPDAVEQTPSAPKIEALVAVVQREVVEFYRQVATAAGLKLAALGLLSHAHARALEESHHGSAGEGVALVSLRPAEAVVDVIANRSLLFSRGAAIVAPHEEAAAANPEPERQPAPDAEAAAPAGGFDFVDAVTIEVVRSLHSYGGMEPGNVIGRIVVTGATGQEPAVVDALAKRLNCPVSLLDLASDLKLPTGNREQISGALSTLGLALGINDPEGLPFDFLNPKRPPVRRDMRRIRMLAGAAAAVLLLFGAIGLRAQLINKRLAVQRKAQEELTAARKLQPLYKQMRGQHTTIDEWLKEGQNWLQHYIYLSGILPGPEEIYVTSLTVSGQGTIRLSVQAKSGEILARLDKQLRAAGYDVKPQAITPGSDKHGYDFRSSVELVVPPKMKIDVSKVKVPGRPADDASLDASKPTAGLRRAITVATTGGNR